MKNIERHNASEPSPEELSASLKRQREDLLLYAGTEQWVPADARKLEELNADIKELEEGMADKEAA